MTSDDLASSIKVLLPYMKVYEQYVVGMLTNFPSLPLDRIHNMLKVGAGGWCSPLCSFALVY